MEWLDIASRLAKSTDTRSRVFDDPFFLPRLVDAVKAAAGSPRASTSSSPPPQLPPSLSNTSNSNTSSCSSSNNDKNNTNNNKNNNSSGNNNSCGSGEGNTRQECRDVDSSDMDDADDPVFDAPPRVSPEAARALCQAFTFLRDSCAGCPANNEALRETGLADTALKFAIDQAPFACGPSSAAPPIADTGNDTTTSSSSSSGGGAQEANGGQTTTIPTETTVAAAATTATTGFDSAEPVNKPEVLQTSGLPQAAPPPPPPLHSTAAPGLRKEASPAGGACHVRLAVRAAVQFVCNYCVGSQENQALLWKEWFPRGLMELANGLKTDRRLLSPSIALIHICCLAERRAVAKNNRGGKGRAEVERGGGGVDRLRRVTADKAFCCLLMKIVPHNSAAAPVQVGPGSTTGNSNSSGSSNSSSNISSAKNAAAAAAAAADPSDDPAAEWLYLLFCRFVQEGLVGNVYDNVGIRGGGRPAAEGGAADATTVPITSTVGSDGGGGGPDLSGNGGGGGDRERNGQEDFFFPVTPEQLIVLNLAEVAAGDEALTGGERPSAQQRHACDALLSWLAGLLAAMPLDQSLRPRTGTGTQGPAAEATAAEAETPSDTPLPEGEGDRGEGESSHRHRQGHGEVVVDGETEQARRGMREEARSAVLRALSALLAGCADDTRLSAAAGRAGARAGAGRAGVVVEPEAAVTVEAAAEIAREVEISSSGRDEVATEAARASAANGGGNTDDARACELAPPQPPTARPQARLVPLCLRLLSGCGGAAEPKAGDGASRGSPAAPVVPVAASAAAAATPQAAQEGDPVNYGVGPAGVPAGRKVELLKVIGNACFRCRPSQDLVRDVGALPLVLNHCAVDGANPLLREYALLAVRNLCEGNPANQESIAALQPQGCTPGMDEALADMGLEGHVDVKGKFRVGPRPPPPPPRPAA